MNLDGLLALLLTTAICAGLAFLAGLLLRSRQSLLGYVGAGLFGQGLGLWLAGVLSATNWPGHVSLGGAGVHLLWTFLGALAVLALFRLAPRLRR